VQYELIYEKLVKRGQVRGIIEGYKEIHHIIPRCMGGSDEPENLVSLTPEEHYVAHQLLVKIYPNNLRLVRACDVMSKDTKVSKYWRRNKMYGWLRRKLHVPRIDTTCKHCRITFKSLKCSNRSFCSVQCKVDSQKNKAILKCKGCYCNFEIIPSQSKGRSYCSTACSSKSQQRRIQKRCECCKELMINTPNIIEKRKFCSKECTDNSRKGKSKPPTRFALIISKPCAQCDNLIYGKPGVLKQKTYCSVRCRASSQRKN